MKYRLSQHALDVIEEREITIAWVERVLFSPTRTEPDPQDAQLEHRLGLISEYGNRILRVIINKEVKPINIVTAYFDRKLKGQL